MSRDRGAGRGHSHVSVPWHSPDLASEAPTLHPKPSSCTEKSLYSHVPERAALAHSTGGPWYKCIAPMPSRVAWHRWARRHAAIGHPREGTGRRMLSQHQGAQPMVSACADLSPWWVQVGTHANAGLHAEASF